MHCAWAPPRHSSLRWLQGRDIQSSSIVRLHFSIVIFAEPKSPDRARPCQTTFPIWEAWSNIRHVENVINFGNNVITVRGTTRSCAHSSEHVTWRRKEYWMRYMTSWESVHCYDQSSCTSPFSVIHTYDLTHRWRRTLVRSLLESLQKHVRRSNGFAIPQRCLWLECISRTSCAYFQWYTMERAHLSSLVDSDLPP